jgi:3-oxoacyl-[acyl-carrier protein] reductase
MSEERDVRRVVAGAKEFLGGIDILVTCAGTSPGGLLEELTDDDWLVSLGSKFLGYVRACQAVIPHMRAQGGGSVVLGVGNAGLKPFYLELVAGAANAANLNVAGAIAEQYARDGVRINTVNPGPVRTQRWEGTSEDLAARLSVTPREAETLIVDALPLGRIAEPEEIASLIAFVASPRASYLNGAHIVVDGGQQKAIMAHASAQTQGA